MKHIVSQNGDMTSVRNTRAVSSPHCSPWNRTTSSDYRPHCSATQRSAAGHTAEIFNGRKLNLFKIFSTGTNLFYEGPPKSSRMSPEKPDQVIKRSIRSKSGNHLLPEVRKKVEEIASLLQVNQINAAPYQCWFWILLFGKKIRMISLNEELDVIVATNRIWDGDRQAGCPPMWFITMCQNPLEGLLPKDWSSGRDGFRVIVLMFLQIWGHRQARQFNKDKAVTERETRKYCFRRWLRSPKRAFVVENFILNYLGWGRHGWRIVAFATIVSVMSDFQRNGSCLEVLEAAKQDQWAVQFRSLKLVSWSGEKTVM